MTTLPCCALLLIVALAGYPAQAQDLLPPDAPLPDAPSQMLASSASVTPSNSFGSNAKVVSFTNPEPHKFFDRQNKIAFGALAGLIAIDAITTQRLISSGRAQEANPIWRPLVHQGWQGEMAASSLGFGSALGVSYTLHKTGHHKMERWFNWLTVGVEAGVDANNLLLDARR